MTGLRHPCNIGLFECNREVIEVMHKKSLRDHGSVEAVVNKLREESIWRNTRVNFANLGRIALNDNVPSGKKDWFFTYLNSKLSAG